MEENEQLEQSGNKVTGGEETGDTQQDQKYVKIEKITETNEADANDAEFDVPGAFEDDASLPSDGPVSESEADDSRPDLNEVKKNPDQEPGVPEDDF